MQLSHERGCFKWRRTASGSGSFQAGTCIILIFNIVMLIWVIAGASTASGTPKDCGTLDASTCNSASDAGTAIGVGPLIVLWALGDVILGVIWLVTNRKKTRDCPACGTDVKKGTFICKRCGYDFRSALTGGAMATGDQQTA